MASNPFFDTPQLKYLMVEVEKKKSLEAATAAYWMHLLRTKIFLDDRFMIAPEQPPEKGSGRRVDFKVKMLTPDGKAASVLLFVEVKRNRTHKAEETFDEVQAQCHSAFDAVDRTAFGSIGTIHALACVGLKAMLFGFDLATSKMTALPFYVYQDNKSWVDAAATWDHKSQALWDGLKACANRGLKYDTSVLQVILLTLV